VGGYWVASDANFDDSLRALLTLFEMASLDGWVDVMGDAADSSSIAMSPQRMQSPQYCAFFFIFCIIGSFFVLNLFVGVVKDNYETLKRMEDGLHLVSKGKRSRLW
jgi:hypothetical protein